MKISEDSVGFMENEAIVIDGWEPLEGIYLLKFWFSMLSFHKSDFDDLIGDILLDAIGKNGTTRLGQIVEIKLDFSFSHLR